MEVQTLAEQLLDHKAVPFNPGDIIVLRVAKVTSDLIDEAKLLKDSINASAIVLLEDDESFDLSTLDEDAMRRHGWVKANA